MENKIIFREMLSEIKQLADEEGSRITKAKIRDHLAGLPLEEAHFQLVYDYLQEQNIQVFDSEEELAEQPEEDGERSLSLYIDEVSALEEPAGEEQELLHRVMRGDLQAREQLIESYLPRICSMAGEYDGEQIPAEDLIQEGNLALLLALEDLAEFDSPAAVRAHLLNEIGRAMQAAFDGSAQEHRMDEGIVSRVNHLNEAVKNLEEDLGHRVSPQELSAYLEMPLEEICDILRMSGDQIEVEK